MSKAKLGGDFKRVFKRIWPALRFDLLSIGEKADAPHSAY